MTLPPRVLLVLSAAGFGGAWVAAPWATAEVPPLLVACLRFTIAALLLFGWCRFRGIPLAPRTADLPLILGVTATSVVLYNILFLYGVRLAPASHGAVIVPGLIPAATVVLARLLLGERIPGRRLAGVGLALVGLVLVVGPAFGGGADVLVGDGLYAAGAMVWSSYTILGRTATRRFHPAAITMLSAGLGAVLLAILSALLEPGAFAALPTATPRALAGVAYLGSIGTVLAFVLYYVGVQQLGAARASAYSVLIPLFGVSLTVTLLGESLEPVAFVGAAIVVAGLWLTQQGVATPPAGGATVSGRATGTG